jgi:hypothetical protein
MSHFSSGPSCAPSSPRRFERVARDAALQPMQPARRRAQLAPARLEQRTRADARRQRLITGSCVGALVTACLAVCSSAAAHVLPMASAKERADNVLDGLTDDPLYPVTSADDTCHRASAHKVHCELFVAYDNGDTCDRDYYVFFASPHSDRIRTHLDPCK